MKPAAFIFDLDGTLINTHLTDFEIHREMLAHLGFTLTPEIYSSFFGNIREEFVKKVLARVKCSTSVEAYLKTYEPRLEQAVAERDDLLVDGAEEFCQSLFLAGIPMMIVTSSPRSMVEQVKVIQKLRPLMQGIITADDVQNHKPDPEPYLMAINTLQEKNIFVFEDSMPGILAASNANLQFAVHKHHANVHARKTAETLNGYQFAFDNYNDKSIQSLI